MFLWRQLKNLLKIREKRKTREMEIMHSWCGLLYDRRL